jgi:hypothetical protein
MSTPTESIIDHTDKKFFWRWLKNEEEVNEVCEYLQKNSLNIEAQYIGECNHYWLEGIDLSGNGYCFRGEYLLDHVRYFRKFKELAETECFEDWIEKYQAFDTLRSFIYPGAAKFRNFLPFDKVLDFFNSKINDTVKQNTKEIVRIKCYVSEFTTYRGKQRGRAALRPVEKPDGEPQYWKYNPFERIELAIDNQEELKKFEEMGEFYVTFEKA